MVKPISPLEVVETKTKVLPDFVIETFNEFIAKNFSAGSAEFYTHEIVPVLCERGGVSSRTVHDNGWLNVEEIYRAEGWSVTYDRPGYNESYRAFYIFRKN